MTAQEAIERIKQTPLMRFVAINEKGGGSLAEALRMAIDALEKQIPANPHYQYDKKGYKRKKCPKCGAFVFFDCCVVCGQRIGKGDSNGES